MTEEAKVDGKTAAEHREQASAAYARVEESWERSDTDGFLSQWAGGLTGQLHARKAQIAEQGGKASFSVLFSLATGDLVPSKSVKTKYGRKQATLDANGRFDKWVGFGDRAARNKGFVWGEVLHPANAVMDGSGHGLSGTAWVATKPVCGECGSYLDAIGFPCRNGHVTPWTAVELDEGGEE